jgi:betaine reductase
VRERLIAGSLKNALIIGKGSLFLGRMTNLFDGVSFLLKANDGGGVSGGSGTSGAVVGGAVGASEDAVRKVVAEAMRKVAEELNA